MLVKWSPSGPQAQQSYPPSTSFSQWIIVKLYGTVRLEAHLQAGQVDGADRDRQLCCAYQMGSDHVTLGSREDSTYWGG